MLFRNIRKLRKAPLPHSGFLVCSAKQRPARVLNPAAPWQPHISSGNQSAFTLAETLISILIMGLFFSATLLGYTRATERAEWAGYSLAAQAQSVRQMEQFAAVLWDTQSNPVHDDTTNVPVTIVLPLDLPMSGTNAVYATNTATVSTVNLGPAVCKMIVVNTTWPWKGRTFTNTLVNYRAPTQ